MHWIQAIKVAREQEDVTYQEWCWLYVDHLRPTRSQFDNATKTAHAVLVRNNVIEESVLFSGDLHDGRPWHPY